MADWLTKAARAFRSLTGVPRAVSPVRATGGWYPLIREPYTGAWQQDAEITDDTALSYWAVFACTTLIAGDIAKLRLRLVEQDEEGIWSETNNPAFSPVLRKPNRYETIVKFIEHWIVSKLIHGNTYVLKERDQRNVVVGLHVLDPTQVTPLVTEMGDVYYQLSRDDLAGLDPARLAATPIVPASEIIHDLMVPLFHPLVGVSPIFACGAAALHGLNIGTHATKFFANGSQPGGLLIAPGEMKQEDADAIKLNWQTKFSGDNVGKIALLTNGIKYEPLSVNPVDAQLIEQLQWTAGPICSCYHVPLFMIDSTKTPPYANSEPLTQQYYSQCIQTLIANLERSLDEGLGLLEPIRGTQYGTEFDIDDLIWLDAATKNKAAHDAIGAGGMSPNEARQKYYGLGSVDGGDSPYMQQQYYSLAALAARDAADPLITPTPAPVAATPTDGSALEAAHFIETLTRKSLEHYGRAA